MPFMLQFVHWFSSICLFEVPRVHASGSFEHMIHRRRNIVRWMDSSVITVASTSLGISPTTSVTIFSLQHCHILINRPTCIYKYNENMGGTDLQDQYVANYRVGIRGKKWHWPIFTCTLDIALNNAWTIYKKHNKNVSNFDFFWEIVHFYLNYCGVNVSNQKELEEKRFTVNLVVLHLDEHNDVLLCVKYFISSHRNRIFLSIVYCSIVNYYITVGISKVVVLVCQQSRWLIVYM